MASFLSSLRKADAQAFHLKNLRTGVVVARQLLPAFDSETRRTGLLKHARLPDDAAMLIAPTNAIHTFFMKFPIDVAFVSRDGRVLKIRSAMPAWRMSGVWRGHAVVEMAAHALARSGTAVGDVLAIERV